MQLLLKFFKFLKCYCNILHICSQYNFSMQDEKDNKIRELLTDLHRTNQQLAECRQQLEMVLKDVDRHTDHLTKSIQNIIEIVKEV